MGGLAKQSQIVTSGRYLMTCIGVCILCGFNRDSKHCTCLTRPKNNDPFHPLFADIETDIRDNRYFGHDALERALQDIQSARASFMSDYVGENRRGSDGWDVKRIDEQSKRLVAIAKGKLFGTILRGRESKDAHTAQLPVATIPTRERLNALLGF